MEIRRTIRLWKNIIRQAWKDLKSISLNEYHNNLVEAKQSYYIIERVDIVEEVRKYGTVHPFDSDIPGFVYRSDCPFADHTDPKIPMLLNPYKKIYYCHHCAIAGNVVGFVMKKHNWEANIAIEFIAANHDLDLPFDL
jgi:DNA primase